MVKSVCWHRDLTVCRRAREQRDRSPRCDVGAARSAKCSSRRRRDEHCVNHHVRGMWRRRRGRSLPSRRADAPGATGQPFPWLPSAYVAQHLALGYALTIHKAQGTTVEVGIVVVEPTVSSEQLYVGMSRGRQENRALVVCERDNFDHAGFSSRSPVEVLASVLGHLGAEASAHEVLRANLARSEDPAFLGRLAEEATRHIEACAGPDRSREIKALEPRADVEGARKRLVAA